MSAAVARGCFDERADLVWLSAGDGGAEGVCRRIAFGRLRSGQLGYDAR